MNKKIFAFILAFSLMQAPQAQAGFFSSFKLQLAAIGLAIANIFRSKTPPRVTSDDGGISTPSSTGSDDIAMPVNNTLGADPNDYQVSTELVAQPANANCVPTNTSNRCSYLEGSQVVANNCVNPVDVRTGPTTGGAVKSGN